MSTPSTVPGRLRDHRFAHIVCHGILKPGKPFIQALQRHLLEPQLPEAGFIFLSNSHTAVLNEESISDEDLNLIVAVQYCGFHGVVGDDVGHGGWNLAGKLKFYKQVFSGRRQLEGVLL